MNYFSNHPALEIQSFVQLQIVQQFEMLCQKIMNHYQLIIPPHNPLIRPEEDI